MNKTVDYLEEKNMYLEKFLGLNRDWLDRLSRGDYAEIESFRENRENILNIVKHLDALIETHSRREAAQDVELAMKKMINSLLNRKDALVKAILSDTGSEPRLAGLAPNTPIYHGSPGERLSPV